jgi:hypothetical protein
MGARIEITGWTAGRTRFKHEAGDTGPLCGPVEFRFPDEVAVTEGERVSCPGCIAARLVREGCPECESQRLAWGFSPRNTSGVVDGRLRLNEVGVDFYLHCEECSETLAVIDAEYVAQFLSVLTRTEES